MKEGFFFSLSKIIQSYQYISRNKSGGVIWYSVKVGSFSSIVLPKDHPMPIQYS